eukprot:NODE_4879_length_632_cov_261.135182.p1 GENE.NODE_4879_length_632_cov_261.135182~~NODE_4879_length_632_cov_261.135182.p1  ORF type:complete len:163 (+),score=20.33 NODE_4879_length_632_cov_261.135182:3-491(+)
MGVLLNRQSTCSRASAPRSTGARQRMQPVVLAVAFLAALTEASERYPVYSPGNGNVDTCSGIKCGAIDCKPPFKYVAPEKKGTCCPVCLSDTVKAPEDRSWTENLTGGSGLNPNADSVLCRGAMCPPLHCPEFEQMFDGRCCTKCKTAATTTSADMAASYKA